MDNLSLLASIADKEDKKWRYRSPQPLLNSSLSSPASSVSPGYSNSPISSRSMLQRDSNDSVLSLANNLDEVRIHNTLYEKLCYSLSEFLISLQLVAIKVSKQSGKVILIASESVFNIIFNSLKAILMLIVEIVKQETTKIVNSTFFRFIAVVFLFLFSTPWGRNTLYIAYYTIAHIFNYKEAYGTVGSVIGSAAMIKNFFQGISTHQITQEQFNQALRAEITALRNQNTALSQQLSQLSQDQVENKNSLYRIEQEQSNINDQLGVNSLKLEDLGFTTDDLIKIGNSQERLESFFTIESANRQVGITELKDQLKILFEITKESSANNARNFNKINDNQVEIADNIGSLNGENAEQLKMLIQNSANTEKLLKNMNDEKYKNLMKAIIGSTQLSVNDITGYLGYFQQYIHFTPGNMRALLPQERAGGKRKIKSRKYKKKSPLRNNTKRMQLKKKKHYKTNK